MTLDHLREIALIQISQAQRTNAMPATYEPRMNITIEITHKRVNDLLTGHLGRTSDWLHSVTGEIEGGFHVHYDREEDAEGEGKGRKHISYAALQKGLAAMATGNPSQFAAFVAEDDDDITFDVAWQFIILGREVYG
jgi:hypothetical protein